MANKAVILLSGGIDSTTTLAIAEAEGFELYAMSFQYGQRNVHELRAAQEIAQAMKVKHHLVLDIDLSAVGGSALTTDTPVPKKRTDEEIRQAIPVTYVPARNIVFLALALDRRLAGRDRHGHHTIRHPISFLLVLVAHRADPESGLGLDRVRRASEQPGDSPVSVGALEG